MSAVKKLCSNCEYQLTRYHNFCPNCGQKVDDKLNMRILFHNTVMNYFSVDARFFRSFIPLLTKPGFLAKEFVDGKRLQYLHPAQFYLFASIVFFFLFSIATRSSQQDFDNSMKKTFGNENKITEEADKIKDSITLALEKQQSELSGEDSLAIVKVKNLLQNDITTADSVQAQPKKRKKVRGRFMGFNFDTDLLDSLERTEATTDEKLKAMGYKDEDSMFSKYVGKQILKFRRNRGAGLLKAFFDTIPISMFFLIPVFAFLLKILYRNRGRFAHHMVFSFYYFAFMFLTSSIMLLSNYVYDIPNAIDFFLIASTFFYLVIALKRFYEQGYFKTFIKTMMLATVYLTFVVPMTFIMLWVISFFIY